jgi:hypothetical protein
VVPTIAFSNSRIPHQARAIIGPPPPWQPASQAQQPSSGHALPRHASPDLVLRNTNLTWTGRGQAAVPSRSCMWSGRGSDTHSPAAAHANFRIERQSRRWDVLVLGLLCAGPRCVVTLSTEYIEPLCSTVWGDQATRLPRPEPETRVSPLQFEAKPRPGRLAPTRPSIPNWQRLPAAERERAGMEPSGVVPASGTSITPTANGTWRGNDVAVSSQRGCSLRTRRIIRSVTIRAAHCSRLVNGHCMTPPISNQSNLSISPTRARPSCSFAGRFSSRLQTPASGPNLLI